jgi:hypothetical protein
LETNAAARATKTLRRNDQAQTVARLIGATPT